MERLSNKELRDFLALQFSCSKNVASEMVHACISIYSLKVSMYREAFETDPIETPAEKLKENIIKENIIKEIDYMIDTWSPIGRDNSNFALGMLAAFGICRNLVLNDGKDKEE